MDYDYSPTATKYIDGRIQSLSRTVKYISLMRLRSYPMSIQKTARPKLPFAIAMKDGCPFTFAGLWEGRKDSESGERLRTCTIITGEPNELLAQIHPRMPVILPEQLHSAWLGEAGTGNLKELLVPYPADQMRMWEFSPRVNSPKNDDPSIGEPVHAGAAQTTSDALELLRE
jgi:putative SOS response-associated peptidase YedK